MNSIDPRVNRLPIVEIVKPKVPLDQFGTYEVFVEPKPGKSFQHEGAVHAPNLEMAYILAKETFTRRFTCSSLYVADTRDVFVSPLTEGDQNVFDLIKEAESTNGTSSFEIYQLSKRGKQHTFLGSVKASTPQEAMAIAKKKMNSGKMVYNIWAIPTDKIRFTLEEEKEYWITLPEKKFRDASNYKGGDKLKQFLEKVKA